MLKVNKLILLASISTLLFLFAGQTIRGATAQDSRFDVLIGSTKILLNNIVQEVRNNDSEKALGNLNLVSKQLEIINDINSTTTIELVKVLVDDVVKDIQNDDSENALLHLDLANEQLSSITEVNAIDSNIRNQTPLPGDYITTNATTNLENATTPEDMEMISRNLEEIMYRSAVTSEKVNDTEMQNLTIDGKEYPIEYNINGGTLDNITANEEQTVFLDMNSTDDGTLQIELPRNIIDSKGPDNTTDVEYSVFADGLLTDSEETGANNQSRTLLIDFENGVQQIEILGSWEVPKPAATPAADERKEILSAVYTDSQDRFMINYPADWEVKPATNRFEDITVEFSSPSNATENIAQLNVEIVPNAISSNADLKRAVEGMINMFVVPNFNLEEDVECERYNFSGKQACSFIYASGSEMVYLQVTTNIGDTEYTITYNSPPDMFDTMLPIAERMIGSFNITRQIEADQIEQQTGVTEEILTIPEGASVQGNPAYEPDPITVYSGATIIVNNKDKAPHTVTNGKDATDPNMGKLFDTSIIDAGESSEIETSELQPGEYAYFCSVHPYRMGTLIIE